MTTAVTFGAALSLYRQAYLIERHQQRIAWGATMVNTAGWRRTARMTAWMRTREAVAVWIAQDIAAGRTAADWELDLFRALTARVGCYA